MCSSKENQKKKNKTNILWNVTLTKMHIYTIIDISVFLIKASYINMEDSKYKFKAQKIKVKTVRQMPLCDTK